MKDKSHDKILEELRNRILKDGHKVAETTEGGREVGYLRILKMIEEFRDELKTGE